MMQIPDPIHGYIELDGMFADIVNAPEFQRLRYVEQGSFRSVYPGARHDRFAHSLGTYHLATKFVEHFFVNLEKDTDVVIGREEQERLSLTFRYAALLHDVGHAPFSHTTEGFFLEKKGKKLPLVWEELCAEAAKLDEQEGALFAARKEICGNPHEIVSALLLIRNRDRFLNHRDGAKVDPVLAARMVIGFTYESGALPGVDDALLGVRNCLIQLLNCSVLDVDRLDYMLRDARMSGFVNAPLDIPCLANAVTAVRGEDGMLVNAYRDAALRVFDLMFQAKLSHDAWVLAIPAGAYDAALLAHCIRQLPAGYIENVFSVEALGQTGVEFNGKHYRLLNDVDVAADLKAQSGSPFDELWTRGLGERRIAAWRSYYEYHHTFNCPDAKLPAQKQLTPENVYGFFKPLMEAMKEKKRLVFDRDAYAAIEADGSADARKAAKLLRGFLMDYEENKENPGYSVVLLDRTNSFTLKLDPNEIRILFPNREDGIKRLPLRQGKYNYSTYAELTGGANRVDFKADYFYLMRRGGLKWKQLQKLRELLAEELKK